MSDEAYLLRAPTGRAGLIESRRRGTVQEAWSDDDGIVRDIEGRSFSDGSFDVLTLTWIHDSDDGP